MTDAAPDTTQLVSLAPRCHVDGVCAAAFEEIAEQRSEV